MAFLASDVIRLVKENLPSFYPTGADVGATPATEALALNLLNTVHADIVQQCGLYSMETVVISLVNGQREYDLDPEVYRVVAATYFSGANSPTPLVETSIDKLDYTGRGWRNLTGTGTPVQYYEQGGKVGFFLTPSVTTVAGFPNATLYVLKRNALTDLDSPLPPQTPTLDAWVYGLCLRWCIQNQRDNISLYAPLAQNALETLKSFTMKKLVRDKPTVRARYPRVRGR